GLSLGLSVRPSPRLRWVAKALAATGAALALVTLAQDAVGRDFGVDALLFGVPSAHPAVGASLGVLLAGVALLLLDVRAPRGAAPSELLAAAVAVIGWLPLGTALYGTAEFSEGPDWHVPPAMDVQTALGLVVLALGIAASRPRRGGMAVLTSAHVGG